jgi:hypothetical protein
VKNDIDFAHVGCLSSVVFYIIAYFLLRRKRKI